MCRIGTLFLVLLIVATAACQDQAKKQKGKITVGKDTTYVTEPLDKDGYVDYAAALNERLRKGVTPANNANVLFWKAIGPHPEGATMSAEFYGWLGIAAPPEEGDYFSDLSRFLKKQGKFDRDKGATELDAQLERARKRPWKANEYPVLADWLKTNAKPLAVLVEASRRTHYYAPVVPTRTDKGVSSGLIGALLPALQPCREMASALAARALLRASQGKDDAAWQDLLACHRIGRLVARGGTIIELLVGAAVDNIASQADLAFLANSKADSKRVEKYLDDLQKLPPFPAMADKVDLLERFTYLEAVTLIDRNGLRSLEGLAGGKASAPDPRVDQKLAAIDWDPALRNGNRWYDRLVAALREPDRGERAKQLDRIDADLKALKKGIAGPGVAERLLDEKQTAQTLGKAIGDVLITLLIPAAGRVQLGADRAGQIQENLFVAFALEAYRRERGGYPKTLDALAPQYLKQIPGDVFSGKALIYRPAFPKAAGPAQGYLLYSVGINGKDEGGRGYDDQPPGDDLSVRMPPPAVRRQ
jgi:hypothetical protein